MKPINWTKVLIFTGALSAPLHAQIVYLDAVDGAAGNTTLTDDSVLFADDTTGATTWRQRDNAAFGSNLSIFEGVEPSPEIKTRISGLNPGGFYRIRVHFWDPQSLNEDWNVKAGFSSGNLTVFSREAAAVLNSVASPLASTLTYDVAPTQFGPNAARDMLAGDLGFTTANESGEIYVYLDDFGVADVNQRTWYDGLSYEIVPDTDSDGLPDFWENAYGLDPEDDGSVGETSPGAKDGPNGALGDPDSDFLTNLQEFADSKTFPDDDDSDDDQLLDGPEFTGASNEYDGLPTDPLNPDSDDDGVSDFEENGSVNTQFANAPTNPRIADTDNDGMPDGYELNNNNPGTALDPNDDGSSDLTQDPFEDRDGDTIPNLLEFTSTPQTRADLIDTDDDGYDDNVEDNFGVWGSVNATGTNPVNPDSDGDGLKDGDENYDLSTLFGGGGFPGQGVLPTNSDPNVADSDFDSFIDSFEVQQGNDPDDFADSPTQASGFTMVEDFEGVGMDIGNSFVGVNGWKSTTPSSFRVIEEPIGGGDKVGIIDRSETVAHAPLSKSLSAFGRQVMEGNTGTLFLQVFCDSNLVDQSIGLSDVVQPTGAGFADFESQMAIVGPNIGPRANTGFAALATQQNRTWMNVWIVADNSADQSRIFIESPLGATGRIEITATGGPYAFRNGTADALGLLLLLENAGPNIPVYIDNIYVDPTAENLSTPAATKPAPIDALSISNVSFEGTDLKITFTPGGAGYILTSSNDLDAPFTEEPTATFDGIDTFTVPAGSLNPGKDFFRVEGP